MIYNNDTLKLLRNYMGYSQKKFADFVGVSQTIISKIEKGVKPLDREFINLLPTKLPLGFFSQRISQLNLKIYYRQSASTAKSTTDLFESRLALIANHLSQCLEELEPPTNLVPSVDLNDFGLNPEELAREIRLQFNLGLSPITDIVKLLESKGVFIHFYDYPFVTAQNKTLDGVSFYLSGCPVILVNNKIQNARKVFTIAHELGHLIMHSNFIVEHIRDVEIEANKFASEFLLPRRALVGEFTRLTLEKLFLLKSYWKVSIGALLYKAKETSLTSDQYRRWVTQLATFRKSEPHDVELSKPTMLKRCFNYFIDVVHNGQKDKFLDELGITEEIYEELYGTFYEKKKLKIIF